MLPASNGHGRYNEDDREPKTMYILQRIEPKTSLYLAMDNAEGQQLYQNYQSLATERRRQPGKYLSQREQH